MGQLARTVSPVVRTLIGAGLLAYLWNSGALDWSALAGLARAWPLSLSAVALLLLIVVLTSWRLCVLLEPHGLRIGLGSSMRLTLVGAFFNTFLPGTTGGDLVRAWYGMASLPGRRTEFAAGMLLDRAVGLLALLLWPLLAAPLFVGLLGSTGALRDLLGAAAVVSALLLSGLLIGSVIAARQSRPAGWGFRALPLGDYARRALEAISTYRKNKASLAAALVMSLTVQTMEVAVMLLLVQATASGGARWAMAILIPLGFLVNALPLTPGGLGVGEVAFDRLFALAGLSGGAEALLAWRILTTLIDVWGLAFYLQGPRPLRT